MTIQEYIRILRQRGWIILLALVLAAAAAYGISFFQKQLYRATTEVSTLPARPDWGLSNSAKDLMRNFALNVRTLEVAQQVIARAQLDRSPGDLLANTQIEPDSSTFTINIQATDRDGEVAKQIALAWADQFVEERTQYYAQQDKRDRIEVKLRSRNINYEQIQPKPKINAIAGGVLGLLLGIGIVLMLTWMEADLLRTPLAAERALGIPVLGAIPTAAHTREAYSTAAQPGRMAVPKTA
ncbi:MAG: Wzz/FepE/Etk N-terminal domain-containing protein [Caldilineaceae bacterium]